MDRLRLLRVLAMCAVASLLAAACFGSGGSSSRGGPAEADAGGGSEAKQGGVVRVGTWMRPEYDQPTLGGAAVRALVLPQLFVVQPDGTWAPSLVEPGTDTLAPDAMSASFRLRAGAEWSDGTPITADDLRRQVDERFVAAVDGPAPDGSITVRFKSALPGWHRLWSFDASVAAPAVGVWGGPWVVESMRPGLETVLRPNDRWWGARPHLEELRLVVVPDATTGMQLLERGELDVVMPLAFTGRTATLDAIDGVEVSSVSRSGWWVGLHADPAAVGLRARRALQSTVLRSELVGALLRDEAVLLNGLAGPEDDVWVGVDGGPVPGSGVPAVTVSAREEEPMLGLLNRSMAKRAAGAGWRTELRVTDAVEAERWFEERSYDAMVHTLLDPPEVCWRCRWGWFDGGLAAAADAGDGGAVRALQERLRDEAIVLPLWRPSTVVAWRSGLEGVKANGYALTAAWNAHEWWRDG